MISVSTFCGVRIRHNPGMHALAWMGYDANDAVVECGMLGKSLRTSDAVVERIECGRELYRELGEYLEGLAFKRPTGND